MQAQTYHPRETSWRLILPSLLFLVLGLLSDKNVLSAQTTGNYWKNNVAILQIRIRTVSPTAYVREIVLLDFNKSTPLATQFGFGADLFADEGLGYDRQSGDCIYTTADTYLHNTALPYKAINRIQSVYPNIIIDSHFLYKKQLKSIVEILQNFDMVPNRSWPVECQLKQCPCPNTCICFACEWGSASWCLDWNTCDTTISLRW